MKFLLDESADARIARHLRWLGHDITTIAADHASSLADREVLEIARREGRILITDDRDFGELIFAHELSHTGVIYLRFGDYADLSVKLDRITYVVNHHAAQLDQFLVVTRQQVRVRAAPPGDRETP